MNVQFAQAIYSLQKHQANTTNIFGTTRAFLRSSTASQGLYVSVTGAVTNSTWSVAIAPLPQRWRDGDNFLNGGVSSLGVTPGAPRGWQVTNSSSAFRPYGQVGVAFVSTGTRPTHLTFGVWDDLHWIGTMVFDQSLSAAGTPIWWNGTAWVDATGTAV